MADSKAILTNGPGAAASLAAGIGCLAVGLFTTLAEASPGFAGLLNFYGPVGPLSGKTLLGVLVWAISWAVLNGRWKKQSVNFSKMFVITLVLVGLGLLGTFPPFFDLFGG
ncbi:MAG: hypothetical protein HQK55_08875 [Deltaproteobacteria bacterium]|nr:hypothetical protein [Deltaproteobacteria bacterium]